MAIQAHYLYSDTLGFAANSHFLMEKENNNNNHDRVCGGGGGGGNGGGGPAGLDDHHLEFIDQFQTQKKKKITPNFDHLQSQSINMMNMDHRHQSMPPPHNSLSALIERHTSDFHHFLHLQNERLRFALQEKTKHQTSQLIKVCESKARFLLNQKEEEITKAASRNMELQDHIKRMEIESQTWQRAAKENEAMAASLTATIQQLRESAYCLSADAAGDAESACCQITALEFEQHQQSTPVPMICRCCNTRNSSMVLLPCRHLCCCKDCEVFLESCPVCRMVKKSSIQALI